VLDITKWYLWLPNYQKEELYYCCGEKRLYLSNSLQRWYG